MPLLQNGTDTALPVRQELVLHKHVQDLGVRCLQELLDGAMPLDLAPAKKASSFIVALIRDLGPRCCFDPCGLLQDHPPFAFFRIRNRVEV